MLYCPANLAPVASRRTVVVIHDLAALRHPGWYSSVYASYQKRIAAAAGPARPAGDRPVGVLAARAGRGSRSRPGPHRRGASTASTAASRRTPTSSRCAAPSASSGPYILVVGTRIARKNLASLAEARRPAARRRASSSCRPARAAPTCAPARRRRCARSATWTTVHLPGPLRGSAGAGDAVALRGLRPAGARGDGQRRARGGRRPDRAARDLRRRRPAGGPRRRRGAGRRPARAPPPTRACASGWCRRAWNEPRTSTGTAAPGSPTPRSATCSPRTSRSSPRPRPAPANGCPPAHRRGGVHDHRQPRAPQPAAHVPAVARAWPSRRWTRRPR